MMEEEGEKGREGGFQKQVSKYLVELLSLI